MTDPVSRPPHKKNIFSIAADEELIQRARDKAGSGARFHGIIRAFLALWSSGAYPDLPEDAVAAQMRRAQKIPRKKQKKR